jgi:hypothetical protein
MRRNSLGALLFALALAIQAVAPAAAPVAMAQASGGSTFPTEICQQARIVDERERSPGRHERRRDLCSLCQISCSGVAPLQARTSFESLTFVGWTALAWPAICCAAPARRGEFSHRARAPPTILSIFPTH